jgi:protein-L-isoaspartate(D-aspartate) O-methyltransferase
MNYEQARFNMIEQQIRPWDVLDTQVLELLAVMRREDFAPLAHKAIAFADLEIPLGHGQVMLSPKVEARMLQDLALHKHEKVLEVGAGSGYMAALMAHRAQRVISYEINRELAAIARDNLQKAGVYNVEVREGDGSAGSAVDGPFDAIVLSGSVAQVPKKLLNQLKTGGRLFAIVGNEPVMRATQVTRVGESSFQTTQAWDTVAPRLQNFPEPSQFSF